MDSSISSVEIWWTKFFLLVVMPFLWSYVDFDISYWDISLEYGNSTKSTSWQNQCEVNVRFKGSSKFVSCHHSAILDHWWSCGYGCDLVNITLSTEIRTFSIRYVISSSSTNFFQSPREVVEEKEEEWDCCNNLQVFWIGKQMCCIVIVIDNKKL